MLKTFWATLREGKIELFSLEDILNSDYLP